MSEQDESRIETESEPEKPQPALVRHPLTPEMKTLVDELYGRDR